MSLLLSIDGSTKATGWSVFDMETAELLDIGVFSLSKDEESDTRKRIVWMVHGISEIISRYKFEAIIMEDVPPSIQNAQTVKMLSVLQGGILCLADLNDIPIEFTLPNIWHSSYDIRKANGDLKEQSVEICNKLLGTNLNYVSPSSKKNEDDKSDSALIGYWYLRKKDEMKSLKPKKKVGGK